MKSIWVKADVHRLSDKHYWGIVLVVSAENFTHAESVVKQVSNILTLFNLTITPDTMYKNDPAITYCTTVDIRDKGTTAICTSGFSNTIDAFMTFVKG